MSRPRVDLLSTSELDALQRKYRSMEYAHANKSGPNDRSNPNNPSITQSTNQNTLRMQRAQIDKLKKDHERIKEELALETRQAKLSNNMGAAQSIAKLQDQSDIFQRKIEIEKRKIMSINHSIKEMDEAILSSRKASGGVNAARDSNISANKSIRILENRLDKALVKFNEALAHNKNLRETIDNLRRERVVFDGIYRKLERELSEKKEKMATIIDISHAAYEARGQAQSEMYALKSNADSQQGRFEREWNALGELIDKDAEMKAMLAQKEAERSFALTHGMSSIVSPDVHNHSSTLAVADPTADQEARLRQKVKRAKSLIRKDRETIIASQSRVLSYEESFAKIQSSTGIADIEQLVGVFVAAEDENFKLFNFVNSLNAEIERADSAIDALKARIQVYSQQDDQTQSSDAQRKTILATLESQQNSTVQATEEYERQSSLMQETLGSLKNSIELLAKTLGVNTEQLPGTEINLADSLAAIEARANHLVQIHNENLALAAKKQQEIERRNRENEAEEEEDEEANDEPTQESNPADERTEAELEAEAEADEDNAAAAELAEEANQQDEETSNDAEENNENAQEEDTRQPDDE